MLVISEKNRHSVPMKKTTVLLALLFIPILSCQYIRPSLGQKLISKDDAVRQKAWAAFETLTPNQKNQLAAETAKWPTDAAPDRIQRELVLLRRLGPAVANQVPKIQTWITHADPAIRAAAVDTLLDVDKTTRDFSAAFTPAVDHTDSAVRRQAIEILQANRTRLWETAYHLGPVFVKHLDDSDTAIRESLTTLMMETGATNHSAHPLLLERLKTPGETANRALRILIACKASETPEARLAIEKHLKDPEIAVRLPMVEAFAMSKRCTPETAAWILPLLRDADAGIRALSVDVLAKCADVKKLQDSTKLLISDTDPRVRQAVATNARRIFPAPLQQKKFFLSTLQDKDPEIQKMTLHFFTGDKDHQTPKDWLTFIQSANPELQGLGLSRLFTQQKKLTDTTMTTILNGVCRTADPDLMTITQYRTDKISAAGRTAAIQTAVQKTRSKNAGQRAEALCTLTLLKADTATVVFQKSLSDADADVRVMAASYLTTLRPLKQDSRLLEILAKEATQGSNSRRKRQALMALPYYQTLPDDTWAPLIQLLQDPDYKISIAAQIAWGAKNAPESARESLYALAKDSTTLTRLNALRVIGQIRPLPDKAVALLIDGTQDKDVSVRTTCILSLSFVDPMQPRVMEALQKASQDSDKFTSESAQRALKLIEMMKSSKPSTVPSTEALAPASWISDTRLAPSNGRRQTQAVRKLSSLFDKKFWAMTQHDKIVRFDIDVASWADAYATLTLFNELRHAGNINPFGVHVQVLSRAREVDHRLRQLLRTAGIDVDPRPTTPKILFEFLTSYEEIRTSQDEFGVPIVRLGLEALKAWLGAGDADALRKLRHTFKLDPAERVVVIGSPHKEDMSTLVPAFAGWAKRSKPPVRLIVVPRFSNPLEYKSQLEERGFSVALWQRDIQGQWVLTGEANAGVLLIDTQGDLRTIYGLADVAVIGHTFQDQALGHNLVEPIAMGVPIVMGHALGANRELAKIILATDAGAEAATIEHAVDIVQDWLTHPAKLALRRARTTVTQDAIRKTITLPVIHKLIDVFPTLPTRPTLTRHNLLTAS